MKTQNVGSYCGKCGEFARDGGLEYGGRLFGIRLGFGGFTLTELMVVVSIIGILSAMAIPAYIKMQPHLRLRSAVREVSQALQSARMTAISKNVAMKVTFDASDESFLIQQHDSGSMCVAVYKTVRSVYDGEGWRGAGDRWKDIDIYNPGAGIPYFDSLECSSGKDGAVIFLPDGSTTMAVETVTTDNGRQAVYLRNKNNPGEIYRISINGNTGMVTVKQIS